MPSTDDRTDDRIDDLLDRMTLEEKVAQLGGLWVTQLIDEHGVDRAKATTLLRNGIGHVTRIGASTGLRPRDSARLMNELQRIAVEETRLGIPIVVHEESTGGYCGRDATVFPQAIGLASTWDPELVESVAEVIRDQLVAVGARHTLAPVLDVARDPRWGRLEETYGEDAVLAGVIGTAYVRGLQTDDLRNGVICTGKHFLAYGLSEGGLNWAPVQLGPRELREVYAEPFAAAIRDAGLASIMNSYSSVDGLPCAGSATILTELLRDELGFDGLVVADYFAVAMLVSHHHTAADRAAAAAQALTAGLDMELPALDCYPELVRLVEAGSVDVALVDRSVRRVLASKFALGLFDQPYVDADAAPARFDSPSNRELARRAAARSIVVLTNDGVLPIDPSTIRSIAVVGPLADNVRGLQGDYHYPAHAEVAYEQQGGGPFDLGPHYTEHVTPVAGLRGAFGDDVHFVDDARDADIAVVCVGGESGLMPHSTVGEARDASDLRLDAEQLALIHDVAATGTPTVVVIIGGRAFALTEVVDDANALVQAWLPGEEAGHGLADVLSGRVDATGRLPVSLARSVGQVPVYAAHRQGGGRSQFWGDYVDGPTKPLFPFGHGLSYTTFAYGDLRVDAGTTTTTTHVAVTVTNTGTRPGEDVVQLYVSDDVASVARPRRQLIGFKRVTLEPAESATVTFAVHPSRLAFYDQDMRFVCEPGDFTFAVGDRSQTVELGGDVAPYLQREIVAVR